MLDDGEVLYTARKYPPAVWGDGVRPTPGLLAAHDASLQSRGLSPAAVTMDRDASPDVVLPKGERWEIQGRMKI